MNGLRTRLSELVRRWAEFIVREETGWRERLRAEGARGQDVEDLDPVSQDESCSVKPATPYLVNEVAKRRGDVRHKDSG